MAAGNTTNSPQQKRFAKKVADVARLGQVCKEQQVGGRTGHGAPNEPLLPLHSLCHLLLYVDGSGEPGRCVTLQALDLRDLRHRRRDTLNVSKPFKLHAYVSTAVPLGSALWGMGQCTTEARMNAGKNGRL